MLAVTGPEDWVGSVTPALNPPEHTRPDKGLSTVDVDGRTISLADVLAESPERVAGQESVAGYGATTALLVKLLDAGWRLPVHGHPTREFARRVFDSQSGKPRPGSSWPPGRRAMAARRCLCRGHRDRR